MAAAVVDEVQLRRERIVDSISDIYKDVRLMCRQCVERPEGQCLTVSA